MTTIRARCALLLLPMLLLPSCRSGPPPRSLDARAQDAINAESARRNARAQALSDAGARDAALRENMEALTRATEAQLGLTFASVDGSEARRETLLRQIEAYAGPRGSWPE